MTKIRVGRVTLRKDCKFIEIIPQLQCLDFTHFTQIEKQIQILRFYRNTLENIQLPMFCLEKYSD